MSDRIEHTTLRRRKRMDDFDRGWLYAGIIAALVTAATVIGISYQTRLFVGGIVPR